MLDYIKHGLDGFNLFPDDITTKHINMLFDFNNHSLVQFYQNLAYFITFYILVLIFIFLKKHYLYRPIKFVIILLLTQIVLGILTLISELNIYLASASNK